MNIHDISQKKRLFVENKNEKVKNLCFISHWSGEKLKEC